MMKSVPESTATIDEQLARLQRPTVQLLNPGMDGQEIRRRFDANGLQLGRELAALYSWHDGTKVAPGVFLDDAHLIPGFYLMSVDEAFRTLEELKKRDVNPSWLPILTNGGGDFSFVDCSKPEIQPIFNFRFEQEVHRLQFLSVRDMLATFAEAYERGVFVLDDGWLEMDDDAYWELALTLNREADYWTH
ncbi:SMI1/KNR4 family protein [Paenarthrobacter aromaticivorans]|uniref:SMI1/KNR4 family protein n=1 Tax=Paenarthrobacter aromaticivorans TaxID=2849150 RepID=UPI003A8063B1